MSDYPDPVVRFASEPMSAARRTAVVFCGLGGPDGPDSVAPFLRNLFLDPEVLSLPRPLAWVLGNLIVCLRKNKVKARYAEIGHGGGSPQLDWTRKQVDAVVQRLEAGGLVSIGAVAMSYWHPFAHEAADDVLARGAEQVLLVPAFPQYSNATSAGVLAGARDALKAKDPSIPVAVLWEWHLLPGYLDAMAQQMTPVLRKWAEAGVAPSKVAIVQAAHSLPLRVVERGDPYLNQTMATAAAVHERLVSALADHAGWLSGVVGGDEPLVAFQSRVGPVDWLEPELQATTTGLVEAGVTHMLLQPISFTCEHIETLHELDIELFDVLREAGVKEIERGASLNLDSGWLDGLSAQLATMIRGTS